MQGLTHTDAARLFLRRAHRAVRWEELLSPEQAVNQGIDPQSQIILTKQNEAEVLKLVSQHPVVAAQQGNPRALIELANKVNCLLPNLRDLCSDSLVVPVVFPRTAALEAPPMQGVMAPIASAPGTSRCAN